LLSYGQSRKDYIKLITNGTVNVPQSNLDTIPVELIDGWIVLNVKIGNQTKKMVWDTGTAYSSINMVDETFEKVNNSKITYSDITKTDNTSELYKLKNMSLGTFQFNDPTFMVIDTKTAAEGVLWRFDGLLGLNMIDKLNWKFDFDRGIVVISTRPFEVDKNVTVRYANYIGYNTFLIRLRTPDNKKLTINALIDFGVTNSSLFLNSQYIDHFKGSQAEISKSLRIGVSGKGEEETIFRIKDTIKSTIGPKKQQIMKSISIILSSNATGSNVLGSTFFTKYNFVRNSENSTFTFYEREKHVEETKENLVYGAYFLLDQEMDIRIISINKRLMDEYNELVLGGKVSSINGRSAIKFENDRLLSAYLNDQLKSKKNLEVTLENGKEILISPGLPEYYSIK